MERSLRLIRSLEDPGNWPWPVDRIERVETHISWVLLGGEVALKIRKPVDLGFLDFSTLARRDHCAHEELRLNRRLAPELYLDVVRITGTPQAPRFDGEGPLIEVAVRMRRFEQQHQLDRELAAGTLTAADMIAVAEEVARFQAVAPRTEPADRFGTSAAVMAPVRENFVQLREACADLPEVLARLEELEVVSMRQGEALNETFGERRAGGFIREGHGDLHLSNLARLPEGIRAFDCIEFSADLRWIDVINEIAFLVMDLSMKGRDDLAWCFLNAWLTDSGDYRGLAVLRFYLLYRTLVRAKVAALRRQQLATAERAEAERKLRSHLDHARKILAPPAPLLVLTCGLSGSGKSWLASRLAAAGGFVHLRSDVERKRLFGLDVRARTGAGPGEGIYDASASALTYTHLRELAAVALDAGFGVIVDATFLTRAQRAPFLELGRRMGLPTVVLLVEADERVLQARLRERKAQGDDPSEADRAVLPMQIRSMETPRVDEGCRVVVVESAPELEVEAILERLRES